MKKPTPLENPDEWYDFEGTWYRITAPLPNVFELIFWAVVLGAMCWGINWAVNAFFWDFFERLIWSP